ncbi:MAG: hypothetical protein PF572_05805 [Patescibacteria group bacterium]|jgi:hypothetical protein|nr:hypothetical protein [Patescibacteria group bacterium]
MTSEISSEDVKKFLESTGFPFEMSAKETLEKNGFKVEINNAFYDLEENKDREYDLLATKNINGVKVYLTIECKQSKEDCWIFICPEASPARYYSFLEYYPSFVNSEVKNNFFNNFYLLDSRIPLANNFIAFKKGSKKPTNNTQIKDGVSKVVKSSISVIANNRYDEENALFIKALFVNAPIFLATYDKRLSIKKTNYLQYKHFFRSQKYEITKEEAKEDAEENSVNSLYSFNTLYNRYAKNGREKDVAEQKLIYKQNGGYKNIDIVRKEGIVSYLKKLEKSVDDLNMDLWKAENPEKVLSDILKPEKKQK